MNKEYKNLPPFKWFVLQNFPFIEADFDSITYYELLSKIGKQTQAITEYLENLGITEEVDKKLDEMAEDGTLADLINEEIFGELNTEIENLEADFTKTKYPATYYKGKNLVIFGDSFSQPNIANSEDEYWCKRVSSTLQMNRFNYAVAGAGFGREGNLLASQLTTAQSQMTADEKTNTAIVIVYAGYNDIVNNVSEEDILSNCITLIGNINTTYPNAKIILAPFNWSYGSLSRDYNGKIEILINRMARETSDKPVVMLKEARYWLLGVTGYFRNSAHPSTQGYKLIASYMLGAILGSSEHVYITGGLVPSHGSENIAKFTFKDGFVNFVFGVKFGEDLDDYAGEQFADLHALLTPETDIIIPLYAVDGYKGTLRLANNGKGYLRNLTVEADTWLLANVTFSVQAWKAWSA